MFPVECVVRGYITGSGWKDYQATGAVCGIELPDGLRESDQLPEPIFTPATKADVGDHDENVDFDRAAGVIGGQPSFDKQYVRDWASGWGWDKTPPAPAIPEDVIEGTRRRYEEAYERITGEPFSAWVERSGASA